MYRLGRRCTRRRAPITLLALALGAGIGGCGSTAGGAAAPHGHILRVTEANFAITTSTASVASGPLTLEIRNAGPDRHELIILPLRLGEPATALPRRPDGFTVDEERLAAAEPGSIAPQTPGGTEQLSVDLAPGRYVLFCNMEGHYMAGMHKVLVVGQ